VPVKTQSVSAPHNAPLLDLSGERLSQYETWR
jgi:hypothetical protein